MSGVLTSDVETSKAKGIAVARFFVDVEGAGDRRPCGNFKVVAFGEWVEVAKKLSEGDRVILVGALLERRWRGNREMEIRLRKLIPLSKKEPQEEAPEVEIKEDESEEEEDVGEEVEE